MAQYQPLAIAAANKGLVKNKNSFVLADDAFQTLENMYIWRGRMKRRPGNQLLGRLQQDITAEPFTLTYGTSDTFNLTDVFAADVDIASIVPGTTVFAIGGQTLTDSNSDGTLTVTAGDILTATINYSTSTVTLTATAGAAGAACTYTGSYYPNLPVMGLLTRELADLNQEQLVAFDTRYSYTYNAATNQFSQLGDVKWSGSNSKFFYGVNYWNDPTTNERLFWVTNHNPADPIRYYNGVQWSQGATEFEPAVDAGGTKLLQAKFLIPNRGRFIALNTYEGAARNGTQYPVRARWSQIGSPLDSSAWRDDVAGRGGYVDCSISEEITDWEYVRDNIIVTMERSTWLLRYTGSELQPYVWERLNREKGARSQSIVTFDKRIAYFGDKTINYCDGVNVESFNDDIPDEPFEVQNSSNGVYRVHGIRNYRERLVFWTYPDQETADIYPNRVLVFNYDNESFAVFRDSITTFGVYQSTLSRTWASLSGTLWGQAFFPWADSSLQSGYPQIVAGNQQGYVLKYGYDVPDDESLFIRTINGGSSQCTLFISDHNLEQDDWIEITDIIGSTYDRLNNGFFKIDYSDEDTIGLNSKPEATITAIAVDPNDSTLALITSTLDVAVGDKVYIRQVTGVQNVSGDSVLNQNVYTVKSIDQANSQFSINIDINDYTAYSTGGYINNLSQEELPYIIAAGSSDYGNGRVKIVPGFRLRSKKFNIIQDGKKSFLGHIDFLTKTSNDGEIKVNIYTDYNDEVPINDGSDSFFNNTITTVSSSIGNDSKTADWTRFYCNTDAQFFEFELTLGDDQLANINSTRKQDIEIEAFILYTQGAGRLAE